MSASQTSMISNILSSVDAVGADMVAATYQKLVSHYSPLIFSLTTIYIGFCYLKAIRGHYDYRDITVEIFRSVFILTLALKYDIFCKIIYEIFTNVPLHVCQAITLNGGKVSLSSVSTAIDQYLNNGLDLCKQLFAMGGWSNPTYLIFGFLLFLFIAISAAFSVGLIVLAKCASIILLSLSPLFIFAALFESTKGLFDSYIRHLITYALIPIMTCSVLMILLSVANVAITNAHSSGNLTLTSITPLCLISVIQLYLLMQVKSKCAGLSGGFNLPSVISSYRNFSNSIGANSSSFGKKYSSGLKNANDSKNSSKSLSSASDSKSSPNSTGDRIKDAGVNDRSSYTYPKNKF